MKKNSFFNFDNYTPPVPCRDFLEWFIGFSEADGSWIKSRDHGRERLYFIINQQQEKVLYLIRLKKERAINPWVDKKEERVKLLLLKMHGISKELKKHLYT